MTVETPYVKKFKKILENNTMDSKSIYPSLSKSEIRGSKQSLSCEEGEEVFMENTNSINYLIDIYRGMLRLLKLVSMKNYDYSIGKVLGVGAYSTVFECKHSQFDFKFALKVIKAD